MSWFEKHPWMTFFLAGSAISGIVYIVRGYPTVPATPAPTPAPAAVNPQLSP